MKRTCRFWALAIVALLAASPVFAQGTTGAIEGKVTDEQGGALPGANVTVQNTATGSPIRTTRPTSCARTAW